MRIHRSRSLVAGPALAVCALVAACGGAAPPVADVTQQIAGDCGGTFEPGKDTTYANSEVGFGRNKNTPRGAQLQSFPDEGGRRFAKMGLFVRGDVQIVLRVPRRIRDDVQMVGWGGRARKRETVKVITTGARCDKQWTPYAGGFVFTGRHCVRLRIEGPGDRRSAAPFGLGRDCPVEPESVSADEHPTCESDTRKLIRGFARTLTEGKTDRAARAFALEPAFEWYSTAPPGERFNAAASDRRTLRSYFAERVGRHERLRIDRLATSYDRVRDIAHFNGSLARSAEDLESTSYVFKGAATCTAPVRTIVWAMAPGI